MKKLIFLGVVAVFLPTFAFAAYVGAGDSVSAPGPAAGNIQVAAQNVYLAGGTVNISNPVAGDAVVAGGTIIISGRVDKDILATGGNISIIGGSAEDIRAAGGNIMIGGKVNGEVFVTGGQINVTSDAVIAKDSYIAGGSLVFAGTAQGNLTLAGGQIRIDGNVNGDLLVQRTQKLTFGPQAVVKGKIEYSAPLEATVMEGAQLTATPVFHKIQGASKGMHPQFFGALFGVVFFLKLIAVLAAAYLLWYLRRRDMVAAIEDVYKNFWGVLLRGFGVMVLVPVAGIILLFTVVGWVPAAVMLAVYGALIALTAPISLIVATSLLMTLFKKNRTALKWYHLFGGIVVLKLLILVPLVGLLAGCVLFLVSLGATVNILKAKFAA